MTSVRTRAVLGLAVLGLAAVGLPACHSTRDGLPTGTLHISGASEPLVLDVEIAETPEARQTGLMHRTSLGSDAGMVFLFDTSTTGGFWMKDTLIPLDIAFWAHGGRIVDILHMTPCTKEPCPLYPPGHEYVGAIEANAGYFARHGVTIGDVVRLERAVSTP